MGYKGTGRPGRPYCRSGLRDYREQLDPGPMEPIRQGRTVSSDLSGMNARNGGSSGRLPFVSIHFHDQHRVPARLGSWHRHRDRRRPSPRRPGRQLVGRHAVHGVVGHQAGARSSAPAACGETVAEPSRPGSGRGHAEVDGRDRLVHVRQSHRARLRAVGDQPEEPRPLPRSRHHHRRRPPHRSAEHCCRGGLHRSGRELRRGAGDRLPRGPAANGRTAGTSARLAHAEQRGRVAIADDGDVGGPQLGMGRQNLLVRSPVVHEGFYR